VADFSEQAKNETKKGVLTPWRWQREGQVRTRKECHLTSGTHFLEPAGGRTSQNMNRGDREGGTHFLETVEEGTRQTTERKVLSDGYSLPEAVRGRDSLEHGKTATERGHLPAGDGRGDKLSGYEN
jgi:hypothetical protein